MAANIAVKDEAMARDWVAKAKALNERATAANQEVARLLRQLDEGAAGEIVTKLVQFGTQVLSFAERIMEGITKICQGIDDVISAVKEAVNTVVGVVKGIVGALS